MEWLLQASAMLHNTTLSLNIDRPPAFHTLFPDINHHKSLDYAGGRVDYWEELLSKPCSYIVIHESESDHFNFDVDVVNFSWSISHPQSIQLFPSVGLLSRPKIPIPQCRLTWKQLLR
jgi:hypothetical protein